MSRRTAFLMGVLITVAILILVQAYKRAGPMDIVVETVGETADQLPNPNDTLPGQVVDNIANEAEQRIDATGENVRSCIAYSTERFVCDDGFFAGATMTYSETLALVQETERILRQGGQFLEGGAVTIGTLTAGECNGSTLRHVTSNPSGCEGLQHDLDSLWPFGWANIASGAYAGGLLSCNIYNVHANTNQLGSMLAVGPSCASLIENGINNNVESTREPL